MTAIPVIITKLLRLCGLLFGRGSSLPGKVALKLFPHVISRIAPPRTVIAVTGSNGKTTTTEMITFTLRRLGLNAVSNSKGSNQTEGIATAVLCACGTAGKVRADCLVLEVDERYAADIFSRITPNILIITNLYRDQLTRNGDPFFVRDRLKDAVQLLPSDTTILLNADEPISRTAAVGHKNVRYFGLRSDVMSQTHTDAVYEDCVCCPVCGKTLNYSSYHYSQLGAYRCDACGFSSPPADYIVSDIADGGKEVTVNEQKIHSAFTGKFQAYNIAAAFAACREAGEDEYKTADALSCFVSQSGRQTDFGFAGKRGTLLISKHENSTAYDLNLEYAAATGEPTGVMLIIDRISRKYFSSDTGWLWDINFGILNSLNIKNIYIGGKYAYDAAVCVKTAVQNKTAIRTDCDISSLLKSAAVGEENRLIVLTCFADAQKVSEELKKWKK